MPVCLLGLGSNLGDRAGHLDLAVQRIAAHPDLEVVAVSRYQVTVPIGGPAGQGEFLNAAARIRTSLSAERLLEHLLEIESGLKRRRTQRWGARTLDLDILLYGQTCLGSPRLMLPHPRMAFRRFVLEPAAEIAPDMIHPELGWTIARLLEHLNTAAPYVAVTGLPKSGKSALAEAVASRCAARLVYDPPMSPSGRAAAASVDSIATHLEILQRRRGLLQRGLLQRDGPGEEKSESISDFWLEQSRAYAQSWLSHAEQVSYREQHDEASQGIITPKLLVFLEMEPQECLARLQASGFVGDGWNEQGLAQLEDRIRDLALSSRRQPVLRLRAEDPSTAVEEVVAAIETMR